MAKKQLFPQISRTITAARLFARANAPLLIALGCILLGILNVVVYSRIPSSVREQTSMTKLMNQPLDSKARADIYAALRESGNDTYVQQDIAKRSEQIKEIEKVSVAVVANPRFPDGYAVLALLELKNGSCERSQEAIAQARLLDANREEFREIEEYLGSKCQITNETPLKFSP